MPWLGSSSGERPLKIFLTPALKSTRTPSRSQNILYSVDDDVVVDDVVSSAEFFDVLKNPERDCCVFAFLECCCACVAEVVRFDMIDEWRRRDGVHLKAIVL